MASNPSNRSSEPTRSSLFAPRSSLIGRVMLAAGVMGIVIVSWGLIFPKSQVLAFFQQPGTITIQGILTDEVNRPIAGAQLTLTGTANFKQLALSQPDGKFSIAAPRTGNYMLAIRAGGYRPVQQQITLPKPEETTIILPPRQLLPTSLRITLYDQQTNDRLAGGVITIRSQNDETTRRAFDVGNGEYFFGRLVNGFYEMRVSVTGYETRDLDGISITSGSTTEQSVLLARVSTIPLGNKQKNRSFTVPKLPANQVLCIYPDRDSSIWFGTTHGVCRYNGQNYESSERTDVPWHLIGTLQVNCILRDRNGGLWFATNEGVYLQPAPRQPLERVLPQSILSSLEVIAMLQDRSGVMWFATKRGVARLADQSVTLWGKDQGLTDGRVNALIESRVGGQLLAATDRGLFRFNGQWSQIAFQNPSQSPAGEIFGLSEDTSQTLWMTTATGLYSLIGDLVFKAEPGAVNVPLTRCVIDALGNIWCVPTGKGVVVYDPLRREAAELLATDQVLTLAVDREGSLWFGTNEGAIYHDVFSFVGFDTSRGLTDSDVYAIASDTARKHLWVGTSRGVSEFDGVQFRPLSQLPPDIMVRSLMVAPDGALWIATATELFRWDGVNLLKTEATVFAKLELQDLVIDIKRPLVWVATTNAVIPINPTTLKPEGEPVRIDGKVRFLTQASSGLLWIATDRGVYRYDPTKAELVVIGTDQGLKSLDVRWILEQPTKGQFWFATGHSVESYDGNRFDLEPISGATKGADVRCLFLDRDGFLWVGLGDGNIRKFLPQIAGLTKTYKRDDYDLTGTRIRTITQDGAGMIWFATDQGLTRHVPNRLTLPIDIKLEVDGAEISQPSPVYISSGQHRLKFQYVGISMMSDVAYLYRLVGDKTGNDEWKLIDADRPNKTESPVMDLPPGEYTFEVRALNRDLYGWNAPPTQLTVRIDRPIYTKPWFLALGITLLASGGTGVFLIRRHQRREYILPPHLKTFRAIEPNPYIVGNPIRQPQMFFGREDDFNYVRKKLEGAAQGLVIVFCGERRTGKSSILYQIQNGRLGTRFVPVFIDMQEMIIESDGEFFQRLARLIAESVHRYLGPESTLEFPFHSQSGTPRYDSKRYPFTQVGTNPFDLFREFINEVLRMIGDRRLILLVDEYELLETKVENKKLNREIFAFLAGLIDSHDQLSFIFTGSKKIEQRDRRYWREMLRRSLFRKVGYLSQRDTLRLTTEPVRDQVVYGRGVVQRIYRLTAGQPFYTQVICQNVIDYLNEHKRHFIVRSDLKHIIGEIVDNPLPQMIYFWEGLSDDEKLVLSLLAEVISDDSQFATAARLARVIVRNDYPVTLSENTIRLTLEELFRSEILIKEGNEDFAYRIDLMRYWIKRSHSIWQVVREVKTL